MKIVLENNFKEWDIEFSKIKTELQQTLFFAQPIIEHIGSTAIPNILAKPIIDILVGIKQDTNIDDTIIPLRNKNYVYIEKYNSVMPYRRFFIKLKEDTTHLIFPNIIKGNKVIPKKIEQNKLAHIHILEYNTSHWVRHIAFRDYLKANVDIKNAYQALKVSLSFENWKDGNEYNAAKNNFIKNTEIEALNWCLNRK